VPHLPDTPPAPPAPVNDLIEPPMPPAPAIPPVPAVPASRESTIAPPLPPTPPAPSFNAIIQEARPSNEEVEIQIRKEAMIIHERAINDHEALLRKLEKIEIEKSHEMEQLQNKLMHAQVSLDKKAEHDLARHEEALTQMEAKLLAYQDHLTQIDIERSEAEVSQMQLAEKKELMTEMRHRLAEKMQILRDSDLDELQIAQIKINLQKQLQQLQEHETLLRQQKIIREE
jgi:hypothetical protein